NHDRQHEEDQQTVSYLAYFHGKRAEGLYADFSKAEQSDPQVQIAEASALNIVGVALERVAQTWAIPNAPAPNSDTTSEPLPWNCSGFVVQENLNPESTKQSFPRSPYSEAALQYYRRAVELQPNDAVLRCNLASASWAIGDHQPMQSLALSDQAHTYLADE